MTSSYPPRWDPAGRPLPPGRRSRSRRPPLCVRDTISKFPWFPVCSLRVLLADLADGRLAIRTFHEQPVVVGIIGQLRASSVPAEAVVHGRHAAAQDDLLIISVILGVLAGAGPGADRSSLQGNHCPDHRTSARIEHRTVERGVGDVLRKCANAEQRYNRENNQGGRRQTWSHGLNLSRANVRSVLRGRKTLNWQ